MASLHQDVTRARDPLTARRAIERCVDVLCQRPAQQVILFFDEFDAVFRALDPFLFRCLRAIRDTHKGQVSYIVAVADDLTCQRGDLPEVEPFCRLVSRNICGLGPYGEADARQMIGYLASRRFIELSERDTARLIEFSGGHAGLLKVILSLLGDTHRESVMAEISLALKDEPAVQAECRKVWDSLPESEQTALLALAGGGQADLQALRRLKRKGLVRESHPESPLLFSPLFADFIRRPDPASCSGGFVPSLLATAQLTGALLAHLEWWRAYYHYVRLYESLRVKLEPVECSERRNPQRYRQRPLAMAAGITNHRWSVVELLGYLVPPQVMGA